MAGVAVVLSVVAFLTVNAHLSADNWQFVLGLRGKKVVALLIVGYAVGVSTLLFQTITHNPILTPSLLGFDAIYVLIQSVLVFVLGSVGFAGIPTLAKFGLEVGLMLGASWALFALLFRRHHTDLVRLVLVGIIFGVLFRSLSSLIARLIDPDEFVTIQSASFAQFNTVDATLMWVSLGVCAVTAVLAWRWRHECDVLLLGRSQTLNLGVDYHRLTFRLLLMTSVLVATATAFVGPVTFLGLLVCALTNRLSVGMAHGERLILVSLLAMLCLVLGQTLFEQVLGMAGVLSVVIEFVGGVAFLLLVMSYRRGVV